MSPTTVRALAPAKINLCLHVTGQRADGYHLIDSLVAFGAAFDTLELRPAEALTLSVRGPEAQGVPADASNLALQAAALLAKGRGAHLTLTKNLPAAAGIGGGSSDAAAAFRAAAQLWAQAPDRQETAALAALGADIPMCLAAHPLRARGTGEAITPVAIPRLPAVLANPRVPVSTPAVFARLTARDNPPLPETLPGWPDAAAFASWLAGARNDLEAPAIAHAPEIAAVRDALAATEGALLARMSGSGATCFALYATDQAAEAAHERLARDHPAWWRAAGTLGDETGPASP